MNAKLDIRLLRQIAQDLGCLPLGLGQAASYMAVTEATPSHYRHVLRTEKSRLLQYRPAKSAWQYEQSVYTTWEVSFAELQRRDPVAAHMLLICAFFKPDDIPYSLFVNAGKAIGSRADVWNNCWDSPRQERMLLKRIVGTRVGRRRQTDGKIPKALGVIPIIQALLSEEHRFEDARRAVFDLSLASPNSVNDGFTIHPLVQAWCQTREYTSTANGQLPLQAEASIILARSLDPVQVIDRDWNRLSGHLEPNSSSLLALETSGRFFADDINLLRAMDVLGGMLDTVSHAEAAAVYQLLHGHLLSLKEPMHILTLAVQGFLGRELQWVEGDDTTSQSENLLRETYTRSAKALGPNHPDTMIQAFNLAENLLLQEKYEEAAMLFSKVLQFRIANASSISKIMQPQQGLAMCYAIQGRLEESVRLLREAVDAVSCDPDKVVMSANMSCNLSGVLCIAGKHDEAEDVLLQSFATVEQRLGPLHHCTIGSQKSLARFYSGDLFWFNYPITGQPTDKQRRKVPLRSEKAKELFHQLFDKTQNCHLYLADEILREFFEFC